jgi:hypothetical protein
MLPDQKIGRDRTTHKRGLLARGDAVAFAIDPELAILTTSEWVVVAIAVKSIALDEERTIGVFAAFGTVYELVDDLLVGHGSIGYVVIMWWFLSVQFTALNDAIGCGGIFAIGFEVIADFIAGLGSGEVFPAVSGERLKDEEIGVFFHGKVIIGWFLKNGLIR